MILWTRSKPADFAEILADLERVQDKRAPETSEPVESVPIGHTPRSSEICQGSGARSKGRLNPILGGLPWRRLRDGSVAGAQPAAAYAQDAAEPHSTGEPPPAEPRALPPRPPRSENEVIAEELGLTRPLATADLRQLRRDFAKRNHPDRCAPAQRPRAARRMSIANMLIDTALKQKQRP